MAESRWEVEFFCGHVSRGDGEVPQRCPVCGEDDLVRGRELSSGASTTGVHWMKVPLIGCPGTECGRELLDGAETRVVQTFKDEFGECDEAGRWMAGNLFLCDKHAALVAEEFGDSLDAIRKAIAGNYGWEDTRVH